MSVNQPTTHATDERFPVEHGPRTGETIVLLHGANAAGWTWTMQVHGLPGRHLLAPDLPGYAGRSGELWPGVAGAADDIAELIRSRAIGGRAHVVGLSLGGIVATHLVHRHPGLVRSCAITGSAVNGYSRFEQRVIGPQVPLWSKRWYWAAQARVFRIPVESRGRYADDASRVTPRTNHEMFREVGAGAMPHGSFAYDGPMLAVSGQHDTHSVARSFAPLQAELPQLQTWIARGMHHAWNVEDPDLFSRMIATHADTGHWPVDRGPAAAPRRASA